MVPSFTWHTWDAMKRTHVLGCSWHEQPTDAPPSPLLDSKEPNYVKGGSRWDLVLLPTSNTKGGERGVLEVPGVD